MRKKNLSLFFTILLNLCFADATFASVKVASSSEFLKISTQVGDQQSVIVLEKKDGTYVIEDLTSKQQSLRHSISKENYDFLVSEFKKLKSAPKIPGDCYRSNVGIEFYENHKLTTNKKSCLYLKTLTSDSYEKFLLKAQILR